MGLRPTFTRADVEAALQERLIRLDAAILRNLSYLGEQCVNQARSVGNYTDRTGNLRSSVGYLIVRDGTIVRRNFERNYVKKEGEGRRKRGYGKSGVKVGEELAEELAKNYPSGYALIVVAGMNYAASVQSKGYDVLSTAEKLAENELPRMLASLQKMRIR